MLTVLVSERRLRLLQMPILQRITFTHCTWREYLLRDDTLLLESDLIFSDGVLRKIMNNTFPNLVLVAKYENWMDGTVVTIDGQNNITSFVEKRDFDYKNTEQYYKTVNIYKFSKQFSKLYYVPFLKAYIEAQGSNEYYEQVLKVLRVIDMAQIKAEIIKDCFGMKL